MDTIGITAASFFFSETKQKTNTLEKYQDIRSQNILICYSSRPVVNKRFRFPVTIISDVGIALVVSNQILTRLWTIS